MSLAFSLQRLMLWFRPVSRWQGEVLVLAAGPEVCFSRRLKTYHHSTVMCSVVAGPSLPMVPGSGW